MTNFCFVLMCWLLQGGIGGGGHRNFDLKLFVMHIVIHDGELGPLSKLNAVLMSGYWLTYIHQSI